MLRRKLALGLGTAMVLGAMPLGASPAAAAINKPPKIVKAEMRDRNGNGLADHVVLTYSERINHRADGDGKYPFNVIGPSKAKSYRVLKVLKARRSTKLTVVLKENPRGVARPQVKYTRTRQEPVLDLKRKQAPRQAFNRTIGLPVTIAKQRLTVALAGDGLGTVTSEPAGIDCGTTCAADFDKGTVVTLTAAPDATTKATFGGWGGACTGTQATCQVTMDAAKDVTASFAKAGSFALTVTKAGTGTGAVTSTSNPTQASQINCGATCSASYPKDAVVTLTATPDAATKAVIAGWSGGGCTGTQNTCQVTMDAAKTVTVTFNKPAGHKLTVVKNGNGTITSTSNPTQTDQINCGSKCEATYPAATVVTLTAAADTAQGALFSGWDGGGCSGTQSSCQVTMDAAKTVTATFTTAGQSQLTVQKAGTGSGAVTSQSNPTQATQINCGATCQASYPTTASVTLTAAPVTGSTFAGWSGGGCSGNSLTCNVTMESSKTVTATFNLNTVVMRQLAVAKSGTLGTITSTSNPTQAQQFNCAATTLTDCGTISFPDGAIVTLTADPAEGNVIKAWGGACASTPATSTTCQVTMDAGKNVTVEFELNPLGGGGGGGGATAFTVTTTSAGPGSGNITCAVTCTNVAPGAPVTVTATHSDVLKTVTITGCPTTPVALANVTTCSFTMPANNVPLTVTFN